jgi:ATP-dependent RNA helicase DDX52/ROK1
LDKRKKPVYSANELPPELDFFRYAKAGPSVKRKASQHGVDQGIDVAEDIGSGDEDEAQLSRGKKRKLEADTPAAPKPPGQRVTSKGKNIPEPIDSFRALKERYNCSSLILSNLEKNGWELPTGIQAHGIPMCMEVCYMLVSCRRSST